MRTFNRKGQGFVSLIIGILIIVLLSKVTYSAITESYNRSNYMSKDFHALVLCQSELNKLNSMDFIPNSTSEKIVDVENNSYTITILISNTLKNTKKIDVEVKFTDNKKIYSKELSIERNL